MDYSKKCPDCAEEVRADARVCRFCGYRFEDPSDLSGRPTNGERSWRQSVWYPLAIGAWIAGVIPLTVGLIESAGISGGGRSAYDAHWQKWYARHEGFLTLP